MFKQQVEERCLRARNLAFTTDGSAIIGRAAQLLLSTNPTWIDIESDLSSAFQRAAREDCELELLDSDLDVFLPLVRTLYGESSSLFYDDFCVMLSEEGSQQGCPLGGLSQT